MDKNKTDVERIIEEIESLKNPEDLKKVDDLKKLLVRVQKLTAQFNGLSSDGRKAVTNANKLNELITFYKDKTKIKAFQERCLANENAVDDKVETELVQEAFKKKRDELEKERNEEQSQSKSKPEIQEPASEEQPVELHKLSGYGGPNDYERSSEPYQNPQLESAKMVYRKQTQELSAEEQIKKMVKFKNNSNIIKTEIAALITKYRDVAQNQQNRSQEATQSGIDYIADEDDIENIVLPGEDSTVLYGLEEETKRKSKIKPIEKLKNQNSKKNRLFKHRKVQLEKAASQKYDGYYDDVEIVDEGEIEKKKIDTKTWLIGAAVVVFIIGCVVATIVMITNL